MNSEFDLITNTLNFVDFHILLGIFGFVSVVIIWGIKKTDKPCSHSLNLFF
jgi:hypothetical protein